MKYENGFNEEGFLQYMYNHFSTYDSPGARNLLENVVDYGEMNLNYSKGQLFHFLKSIVPEIEFKELLNFFDDEKLTNSLKEIRGIEEENKEKIENLDGLKEKIENLGWGIENVSVASDFNNGWEIFKFSPAGQDFSFVIEHDNNLETAVKEIIDYTENGFDKDENIEMYIEARNNGLSGVPSTRELVEDSDEIQDMLDELKDEIESFQIEPEKSKDEEEDEL